MRSRLSLAALAVAALCLGEPAGAADHSIMMRATAAERASALNATAPAVVAPAPASPVEDSVSWADEIKSMLWWMWRCVTDMADSLLSAFSPPSPGDIARQIEEKDSELWSLIEDAGYAMSDVSTSLGFIPSAQASFVLVRELSPADREQLEWRLERYALQNSGLSARMQRLVLYDLLDASEAGTYKVERIDLSLWPIPSAKLSLGPAVRRQSGPGEPAR
jgi:hypothetical protein